MTREYANPYYIPAGGDALSEFERDQKVGLHFADIGRRLSKVEGLLGEWDVSTAPRYSDMTATRLVQTNSDNKLVSVENLANWVGGVSNEITIENDGDGTITVNLVDVPHVDGIKVAENTRTPPYTVTEDDAIILAEGSGEGIDSTVLLNEDCSGTFTFKWIDTSNGSADAYYSGGRMVVEDAAGSPGQIGGNALTLGSWDTAGRYTLEFDWYPVPGDEWFDDDLSDAEVSIDFVPESPTYYTASWQYNRCEGTANPQNKICFYLGSSKSDRVGYGSLYGGTGYVDSFTHGANHAVKITVDWDMLLYILEIDGSDIISGNIDGRMIAAIGSKFRLNFHSHNYKYRAAPTWQEFDNIVFTSYADSNITMPSDQIAIAGRPFLVMRTGGTGTLSLVTEGSETINGENYYTIYNDDEVALLWSDGSNLYAQRIAHDWLDDGSEIAPVNARDLRIPTTSFSSGFLVDYSADQVEVRDSLLITGSASPVVTITSDGGRTVEIGSLDASPNCYIGTTTSHGFKILTNDTERGRYGANDGYTFNHQQNDYDFSIHTPTYTDAVEVDAGDETLTILLTTTITDARVLFEGTTGSAPADWDATVEDDTGLLWVPDSAALRAGLCDTDAWDAANIGFRSVGLGENAEASDVASMAFGIDVTSSGRAATVTGEGCVASGESSFATGKNTTAAADYSMVFGNGGATIATAEASFVGGWASVLDTGTATLAANGDTSFVFGYSIASSGGTGGIFSSGTDSEGTFQGGYAFATGAGVTANIYTTLQGAFAWGYVYGVGGTTSIKATAQGAFAVGYLVTSTGAVIEASGAGSFAHGYGFISNNSITASGTGAFAHGAANTGDITASGTNSMAVGDDVTATASNSYAFGLSVDNATASSFRVGFSANGGISVQDSLLLVGDDYQIAHSSDIASSVTNLIKFSGSKVQFNPDDENLDVEILGISAIPLFYVDASGNRVGVGRNSPASIFEVYEASDSMQVRIENRYDSGTGAQLQLRRTRASNAAMQDGDVVGRISWIARNDAPGNQVVAYAEVVVDDVTSTSMDTTWTFYNTRNDSLYNALAFNDAGIVINEDGETFVDVRIETTGNENFVVIDAGQNTFGIGGVADTSATLHVQNAGNPVVVFENSGDNTSARSVSHYFNFDDGAGAEWYAYRASGDPHDDAEMRLRLGTIERVRWNKFGCIFNVPNESYDWRVETPSYSHNLMIDASEARVMIGRFTTSNNYAATDPAVVMGTDTLSDVICNFLCNDGSYGPRMFISGETTGIQLKNSYQGNNAQTVTFVAVDEEMMRYDRRSGFIFNNDGYADHDHIIKGGTDEQLFNLDAGLDAIGIGGDANATYKLLVNGETNPIFGVRATGDDSADRYPDIAWTFSDGQGARIQARRLSGGTKSDVQLRFYSGDATQIRGGIDHAGSWKFTQNATAFNNDYSPTGVIGDMQMIGDSNAETWFQFLRFQNNNSAGAINFAKSRASGWSPGTIVQDDDLLGAIWFVGDDGTDLNTIGALISVRVDGTPDANKMPCEIEFYTAEGASANDYARKFTMTKDGYFRAETSIWWKCFKVPASSFSKGSSGSTWVDPDSNTLGGYNLDADSEELFFEGST
jgi:hypothetical protein